MPTTKLFCVLLAVVLFGAAVPALGSSHLASDPDLNIARALLAARHFDEALALLRKLDRGRADIRTDVLFLTGLAATGAAQKRKDATERDVLLGEAVAALREILIDRPGLVRVRLELARVFFLKGEDGLARQHFESVLAGRPPIPVVLNVRRFLSQMRKRRRWDMHFGFALAPDTNIGGASKERIIYIFGLPFVRDAEELTTSGIGLSVWGGGEYQHPLSDRLRLRMGVDASRREYSGGKFDQMLVSLHVGPRVLATKDTEFSVLANWRHQWSANEANYFDLGGRMTARHRFNDRLAVNGRASWYDRRYRTNKYLDGPVLNLSLNAGWSLTPTVRLNAGGGYGRGRPETLKFRNESKWVDAGVTAALPRGFTVGGSGAHRWTSYEGNWSPHTPGGVPREDKTLSLRASVHNRALTFYGFSPQVSIVREVRKTNAQLYDYKRTSGELRFVRQF